MEILAFCSLYYKNVPLLTYNTVCGLPGTLEGQFCTLRLLKLSLLIFQYFGSISYGLRLDNSFSLPKGCEKVVRSLGQPGTCSAPASSFLAPRGLVVSAKACPGSGPPGRQKVFRGLDARVWARQNRIRTRRSRLRSPSWSRPRCRSSTPPSALKIIFFMGGFSCWRNSTRVSSVQLIWIPRSS